jgi:cytosine/adenosine deaminase-related metal-dependent hydrolase
VSRIVIERGTVSTMDLARAGTEYTEGHVVIDGDRIRAVGSGPAPDHPVPTRRIDASGCLVTPGLVNTHHHLYQSVTRGYAVDSHLFDWLSELYPVWAGLDEEIAHAAAASGVAWAALSGCTTTADHHYVFPRGGGDVLAAAVSGATKVGTRLHTVRGSMDRGRSQGGLPPDSQVEDIDSALEGTEEAIDRFHDPAPNARIRVAVGPCSPFSVSTKLMTESAALARKNGVRLHTHLGETVDEERQCRAEFGRTPVEYAEHLGWLGSDVWLAHAVHLSDDAVRRLGETGTGVAHCPSSNGRLGSGAAPIRALLDAGAPVGLGIDGAASNEAGRLGDEMRQALLTARTQGGSPRALSVREALWLATRGGARCLGREDELGTLEPGKLADVTVWRLDDLAHVGIDDPIAALVLGPLPKLEYVLCGGQPVVEDGCLTRVSETELARELRRSSARIRKKHLEVAR